MTTDANLKEEFERFVYNVSHDLGTPIRQIGQLLDLYQSLDGRPDKAERRAQLLSMVGECASEADKMLEALVYLSRLSTRGMPMAALDLGPVLAEAADLAKASHPAGDVALDFPDPMPPLVGSRNHLVRAFEALIDNGLKFHKPETLADVHLSVRQEGAGAVVEINDAGIGIDPQFAEDVFTIFRKLQPRHDYAGVGAGLSLARAVIEGHGGTLICIPGAGQTRFELRLPLQTEGE
ncbi:MAG: HAMP domain-containing sensor histidine kinase [Pseudomonadota bacterium]